MRTSTVRVRLLVATLAALSIARPALAAAQPVAAQPQPVRAWLTAGFGVSSQGLALIAGIDRLKNNQLLSLRYGYAADLFDDEVWDLGLLYGKANRSRLGFTAFSAGVAAVGGKRCKGLSGCTPISTTVGVPLSARAAWHALPVLGFEVNAFGNLNAQQSFFAAVVALKIGSLR